MTRIEIRQPVFIAGECLLGLCMELSVTPSYDCANSWYHLCHSRWPIVWSAARCWSYHIVNKWPPVQSYFILSKLNHFSQPEPACLSLYHHLLLLGNYCKFSLTTKLYMASTEWVSGEGVGGEVMTKGPFLANFGCNITWTGVTQP